MDLEMPVMDGWEAARRLKSAPETSDIPIIALSAHALAGEREKALAAGCDEFDTKPIEFEQLVATLRRVRPPPKGRFPGGVATTGPRGGQFTPTETTLGLIFMKPCIFD